MSNVFISYRRSDTAGYARWLYEVLSTRLGEPHVFIDVDTIGPGEDFVERIRNAVGASNAFIPLIGRHWLVDETGARRIDDPDDFIRLEVAAALSRTDVRVVPVLVDGAQMPKAVDLPPDIASLANHNAIELSAQYGGAAVKRLLDAIGWTGAEAVPAPAPPRRETGGGRGPWRWALSLPAGVRVAVPVVLLAAVAALVVALSSSGGSRGSHAVLPPATVPSKAAQCSTQLQIGADGTAGPITCGGGRLNTLAWLYYGKNNPLVMTIGPNATPDQVLQSMCTDVTNNNGTIPIELEAYHLAQLYYGWSFGVDPSGGFPQNCPKAH